MSETAAPEAPAGGGAPGRNGPGGFDLGALGALARRGDIGLALGVIAILLVLILPMPAVMLDGLLAISITFSVLILMTALFIQTPLEFSTFPTVLLIATMLRLSLNIATTRLILTNGAQGETAAGHVIAGFSRFVMSGDFIIGVIVFLILVTVNFVVITKGATRIAEVGARGGTGFSADGKIQIGSDGFLTQVVSKLPPEENAGQALAETNAGSLAILALEDAYNPEKGGSGLTIGEYKAFKKAGITAPKISSSNGPLFQSDVTSVDPATASNKADGSRRRLADFVIKTLAQISQPFVKKLNTPARRRSLTGEYNAFLLSLSTPNNPDTSRIAGFSVKDDSTDDQRAAGIQAFNVKIRSYPAMLTIKLRVEVGTTVNIDEQ